MNLCKILSVININKLLLGLLFVVFIFMALDTILCIVPWYQMKSIEIIYPTGKKTYSPGDTMRVFIIRKALIDFEARTVRELIKINEHSDEIVYKVFERYGVEAGNRESTLFFKIPTLLEAPGMRDNSYIWKATMVYKPFGGPEKTHVLRSEKFYIEVKKADS